MNFWRLLGKSEFFTSIDKASPWLDIYGSVQIRSWLYHMFFYAVHLAAFHFPGEHLTSLCSGDHSKVH